MIRVMVLYSASSIATQILVQYKDTDLLIDCGDGTLRDLVVSDYDFNRLASVLITHEHIDHISGLIALLNFMNILGRSAEFIIVGLKPMKHIVMLLSLLDTNNFLYSIKTIEAILQQTIVISKYKVKPFSAEHGDCVALGCKIEDNNSYSLVVNGDARVNDTLRKEVSTSDYALLEATLPNSECKLANELGHMAESQVIELRKLSKTCNLIHKIPCQYFSRLRCKPSKGN